MKSLLSANRTKLDVFPPLAGTFSSIHRTVRDSLNDSLLKLLTPKRRIDIIRDVLEAKQAKRY